MPATIPVGPYRALKTNEGVPFPYYIIPFDKDGNCEGPKTQEHVHENCAGYSNIYLFSHGWNNDWTAATSRYEDFINGVQKMRQDFNLPPPPNYKPLLVGVFWPSQAMEWFEDETGPEIAAADPAAQDAAVNSTSDMLRDIASELPREKRERFYELFQIQKLNPVEAKELADLFCSLSRPDLDEGVVDKADGADLLAAAAAFEQPEPDLNAVGTVGQPSGDLKAAGILDVLFYPRNIVKPFTVWQMKDRAGVVGAKGASQLLQGLLDRSQARIHLIGHSFGCKVVMTALCKVNDKTRPVDSVLLLQPAVSQFCFAPHVPKRNVPGGYFKALGRVKRPIVCTFSAKDMPLTKLFHAAVRRKGDVGELQIAGWGEESVYGALGGFGPKPNYPVVDILDPTTRYQIPEGAKVVGINGTRRISGHGDINNSATWWALYSMATMADVNADENPTPT